MCNRLNSFAARFIGALVVVFVGVTASAATVMYIDPASTGALSPYASAATASSNLTEAVTAARELATAEDPVEIRVAKGTYRETGFVLDGPIAIVGATGDPKDVEIVDNAGGKRAFTLSHADAAIRFLTVSGGGYRRDRATGGHVYMTAGLVERCILRDGIAGAQCNGNYEAGYGGNVWMSGGRLVCCEILNGKTSSACKGWTSTGSGVHAEGGTVDSCLFFGNGVSSNSSRGGGLYAKGSTVVANCTFVDNLAGNAGGGIYVDSANVKVVNCVFYANGGTLAKEIGPNHPGCFTSCASSVTNDACATWRMVTRDDFVGYEAHDLRAAHTSSLINGGTTDTSAGYPVTAATTDVAGGVRVSGTAIDIGCYELDESVLSVSGYPSTYLAFEDTNVTFTAKAYGASGSVSYRWDFGDGTVTTTDTATFARAWTAAGLYAVRLSASDDGGTTWTAWRTLPVKVRVVPAEMFVDPNSPSPTAPYRTRETAAHTFAAAFLEITNNVSDGYAYSDVLHPTVRLCAGTITETGMTLKYGVHIVGDTGNPADAIINDAKSGKRAFTITHPKALVRDLTIKGTGYKTAKGEGGHIRMTDGTVEHCVIKEGYAGHQTNSSYGQGLGGNVYMTGGRLVRCQVLNGNACDFYGGWTSLGEGVVATGGTIDSCLVRGNGAVSGHGACKGGGIYASGTAYIVNCTVADNASGSSYGICVDSANVRVANCVFYGNGGTAETEFGPNNHTCFSHCASSVTNDACATWKIIGENDFTSYAAKDFSLVPASGLRDAGTEDADWVPSVRATLDLAGGARVSGAAVDIGAYELDQSQITCGGALSAYAAFEGSNITFTASAIGGSGVYRFRWILGNGVTNETTSTVASYSYPASGLFTVSLCVSGDGGATWTDPVTLVTKVVVAPDVMYVDSASATPTFPYKTRATAAKTVKAALAALTNNVSAGAACLAGATVRICAGTHAESGISLTAGITIAGDTGNPADVTISDNVQGSRAFTLNHSGAVVRDLTISGGGLRTYDNDAGRGGHVNMSAGLVENCIITGGTAGNGPHAYHGGGYGGNVYMTGGRLVRCQILNGNASRVYASIESAGEGVYASGGTVDSCLVRGNGAASGHGTCKGGGICAAGTAYVVNCTVADNASGSAYGICANGASVRIANCVLYGNGGTAATEFGTANLDRFSHCASSVTNDACATWKIIGENDFSSYSAKDFSLVPSSVMRDAGTEDSDWVPSVRATLDISGSARVSGSTVDIGAYEIDQSKVSFGGNLSSYTAFEGSNVTFNASAVGGSGEYVFRWNFGNGVTRDTTDAAYAYAYPTAGLFAVSLAVSDNGGSTWSSFQTLVTKIVVAPEAMFVDATCAGTAFPYKTRETAAKTLKDALAALTNTVSAGLACVPGATIRLCRGTHDATGITLNYGIRIVGDTGDPADVTVSDNVQGSRGFTVGHADALLKDFTISGSGQRIYDKCGGHVYLTAGTLEHCIIRDGIAGTYVNAYYDAGYGGNVYMTGGRLVRCQILNGKAVGGYYANGGKCGDGVYATGGIIENCLVRGNGVSGKNSTGGGIYASGSATVLNCTVVGNGAVANGGGIYVNSASVRVVNSVFYDNGGTAKDEFGTANLDLFVNCASSVANESCETWRTIDETAFMNYAQGTTNVKFYRPGLGGALVDGGCTGAEYFDVYGGSSTVDLRGADRLTNRRLDIGCLEAVWKGSLFRIR